MNSFSSWDDSFWQPSSSWTRLSRDRPQSNMRLRRDPQYRAPNTFYEGFGAMEIPIKIEQVNPTDHDHDDPSSEGESASQMNYHRGRAAGTSNRIGNPRLSHAVSTDDKLSDDMCSSSNRTSKQARASLRARSEEPTRLVGATRFNQNQWVEDHKQKPYVPNRLKKDPRYVNIPDESQSIAKKRTVKEGSVSRCTQTDGEDAFDPAVSPPFHHDKVNHIHDSYHSVVASQNEGNRTELSSSTFKPSTHDTDHSTNVTAEQKTENGDISGDSVKKTIFPVDSAETVKFSQNSQAELDEALVASNSPNTCDSSNCENRGEAVDTSYWCEQVSEEAKRDAMAAVEAVHVDTEKLHQQIDCFNECKGSKGYKILEEMLIRNMLTLDNVDCFGDNSIRSLRKETVKYIQRCLDILEQKAACHGDIAAVPAN